MLPLDTFGRLRLLPASVPMRFFGAAAVFHATGWTLLALALVQRGGLHGFTAFPRGPGPALAALHAWTLGTLTMTAFGVALQAIPVLTAQSAGSARAAAGVWWALCGGVASMVFGLAAAHAGAAAFGALLVTLAAVVFAARIAMLLARSRRGGPIRLALGCALGGLLGTLLTGGPRVLRFAGAMPDLPDALRAIHPIVAAYGFLGFLVLGLSARLIPMFLLVRGLPDRRQRATIAVCAASLIGVLVSIARDAPPSVAVLAATPGGLAVGLHAVTMWRTIGRRRARDPRAGVTVLRLAWIALAASVPIGLGLVGRPAGEGARQAFVALLIHTGLISLVLGLLARIVPFLAQVHQRFRAEVAIPLGGVFPARLVRVSGTAHLIAAALLPAGLAVGSGVGVAFAIAVGHMAAFAALAAFALILRMLTPGAKP